MQVMALELVLKKKWFDMIVSGEKKEEYRDIKPYWNSRLGELFRGLGVLWMIPKSFTLVRFRNGYAKNAPVHIRQVKAIFVSHGNTDWGAEAGKNYHVIQLGDAVSTEEFEQIKRSV